MKLPSWNDESEESKDNNGNDAQETTQAEDKDQSKVLLNEEYVFFDLRLCSSHYRHQQSAPKELDFVFDAICKRLPTTVSMLTQLSDHVQDVLALARHEKDPTGSPQTLYEDSECGHHPAVHC